MLSNGNALAVPGLRDLEKGTLAGGGNGEDGEVVVGTVRGLSSDVVDKLRAVEAFKSSQSWGLFRRPAVLVRKETVQLVSEMDKVVREKGVYRVVIDGERISGKSTLLLQAMAHGFLNGWTVVHIPEGKLTCGLTECCASTKRHCSARAHDGLHRICADSVDGPGAVVASDVPP